MKNEIIFQLVGTAIIIILALYFFFSFHAFSPLPAPPSSNQTNLNIVLTAKEIAKHATGASCWLLISGKVYDATSYLPIHPGGAANITNFCGTDATQAFLTKGGRGSHSAAATNVLSSLYLGDLNKKITKNSANISPLPLRGGENEDE